MAKSFDYDYWKFKEDFNQMCKDQNIPIRMVRKDYTFDELHFLGMTRKVNLKEKFKLIRRLLFETIYVREEVKF